MNTILFLQLHSLVGQSVFIDTLVIFLAQFLIFVMAGILLVTVLLEKEQSRKISLLTHILASVLIVYVIVTVCKLYFAVPRPFVQFPHNTQLFSYGGFDSFPSGHAAFASLIATLGYLKNKRLWMSLSLCAILVGVARIVSGVHFPVDIIVGYMIGIMVGGSAYWFSKRKNI